MIEKESSAGEAASEWVESERVELLGATLGPPARRSLEERVELLEGMVFNLIQIMRDDGQRMKEIEARVQELEARS